MKVCLFQKTNYELIDGASKSDVAIAAMDNRR